LHLADFTQTFEGAVGVDGGQSCGVIAAVFEALQASNQDRCRAALRDDTDNATHNSSFLTRRRQT
jgi:hypothetical protein